MHQQWRYCSLALSHQIFQTQTSRKILDQTWELVNMWKIQVLLPTGHPKVLQDLFFFNIIPHREAPSKNFLPHSGTAKIRVFISPLLFLLVKDWGFCNVYTVYKLAVARSPMRPVSSTGDYSMEATGPFCRLQKSLQLNVLPDIYGDISCNTIGPQCSREVTPIFMIKIIQ